jgi:hypothetical protein
MLPSGSESAQTDKSDEFDLELRPRTPEMRDRHWGGPHVDQKTCSNPSVDPDILGTCGILSGVDHNNGHHVKLPWHAESILFGRLGCHQEAELPQSQLIGASPDGACLRPSYKRTDLHNFENKSIILNKYVLFHGVGLSAVCC